MTLANKITIGRLVLIPVFVVCATMYGASYAAGEPRTDWRLATLAVFAVAAISDAIDGYIARHFNQKTLLGTTLDPIADKTLLLVAIFTLAVTPWNISFPVWFVVLLFSRETIILLGIAFMYGFLRKVEMGPHWSSKLATALQMACVVWILLDFREPPPAAEFVGLIWVTAVFMVISTAVYVREGIRQFAAQPAEAGAEPNSDVSTESTSEPGTAGR